MRTVSSPAAEASRVPSGLNATEDTESVWPVRTARASWLRSAVIVARASLVLAMDQPARRSPHLLDDHTVERIKQVFGVRRDDMWLWVETGERWQART